MASLGGALVASSEDEQGHRVKKKWKKGAIKTNIERRERERERERVREWDFTRLFLRNNLVKYF